MTAPRHRVEIAWEAGPWDTAPAWTDVTPWVLGLGYAAGRQPRDPQNRPSKLTVELDNRDGRFSMLGGGRLVHQAGWETDTDGWVATSGTGSTAVRSTTLPRTGTGSLRVTYVGAGTGWASATRRVTGVQAGRYYAAGGWVRAEAAGRNVRTTVAFYDLAGAPIASSYVDRADVVGAWTFVSSGWVLAPAGAVALEVTVAAQAAPSGEHHHVDDLAVVVGDDPATWVDLAGQPSPRAPFPPWWPNVLPRRQVRWQVDHNGTTYTRFVGVLQDLPTVWSGWAEEVATYTAVGRSALLADMDLPDSAWETVVPTTAPYHWWRLADPESSTQAADDGSAGQPLTWAGAPARKVAGAAVVGDDAREIKPGSTAWRSAGLDPVAGTAPFTVALVVTADLTQLTRADPSVQVTAINHLLRLYSGVAFGAGPAGFTGTLRFDLSAYRFLETTGVFSGEVRFYLSDGTNAATAAVRLTNDAGGTTPAAKAGTFFIVARRNGATLDLFVDDIRAAATSAAAVNVPAHAAFLRHVHTALGASHVVHEGSTFEDVAAWTRALTDAEVAQLRDAIRRPWAGDTAGTRVERLRGLLGLPAGTLTASTGATDPGHLLGPTRLGGKALAYLHRLARSVRGRIVDRPDGTMELRAGADLLTGAYATSQATFGSAAGELAYESVGTDASFQRLVTSARAAIEGGTPQTYTAKTEAALYGARGPAEGAVTDLLLAEDRQARDWARWRVGAGKQPDVALDPLVLHPLGDDAVTTQVLARGLDHMVTVRRKHPSQPLLATRARIAGVIERISRTGWRVEWRLEPADPTPYVVADGAAVADGTAVAY